MKESISYSFLLNIVILFVFTCFAIVMGILSYYKAFKANTIISETIEKYEGYNCVSAEEIATKLGTIGYGTPFDVTCNGKGENCMTDTGQNYAIISYNLDDGFSDAPLVGKKYDKLDEEYIKMNSSYKCDSKGCATNKHYQYGIYTYMYVDLPVISSLIRIPFFSKTSIMYEFRNFSYRYDSEYDQHSRTYVEGLYEGLYSKEKIDNKLYINDLKKDVVVGGKNSGYRGSVGIIRDLMMHYYVSKTEQNAIDYTNNSELPPQAKQDIISYINGEKTTNYRTRWVTSRMASQGDILSIDAVASSQMAEGLKKCGYIMDYSKIN